MPIGDSLLRGEHKLFFPPQYVSLSLYVCFVICAHIETGNGPLWIFDFAA
jgi:hypothetical protein